MIHQDIRNFTRLLCHPNPGSTRGYANDPSGSCDAGHEHRHKSVKRLSCGRFQSFSSCSFHNAKCFKRSRFGQIRSVFNTNVHFAAINTELCNSDPLKLNPSNESYSEQTRGIILQVIRCSHDSCISNELISKYVEDILGAPSPGQNSGVTLSDVVYSDDLFTPSDILIKCEK
ncbi:unnamed protein product [Schistosoma curassoni]|uniref:RGM_C domain-containing protein n=1 Tax=Schistosoma curassoni TaxID=6186 RepID=A0A183K2J8_9TREM|nr:unnamed protein product [Schistosoma curassoni]